MATLSSGFIVVLLAFASANFSGVDVTAPDDRVLTPSIAKAEDKEFVIKAADAGLLEIKAAEVAARISSNEDIKTFANTMIADHGKANAELQALAKEKSITPRSTLSTTSEQKLKKLQATKAADFDRAYAQAMVRDHEEAVALFKSQADNGKDAELKQWASEKLPALEHHLSMAQELEKKFTASN